MGGPGSPEPARLRTRVWQNSTSGRWHWAIWQPRPDLAKPENPKPIEKFGCGGYSSEEAAARALTYQREALVSRSRKESG
jgi:hypothetical protein